MLVLIFATDGALSAGRALSLLDAEHLRGLICPAAPAGVARLSLQLCSRLKLTTAYNRTTSFLFRKTNLIMSLHKKKER